MRSTRSAKNAALKKLSSCFEDNRSYKLDTPDTPDTLDTLDNSDDPEEEKEVFTEKDIILVDYNEEPRKQGSRKRGRKSKGCSGKPALQDSGFEEDFDEYEAPEALLIDYDMPLRKLQSESKIFLRNIDTQQIPDMITEREISRFGRLERVSRANLKMQTIDEVMVEESEEESRSMMSNTSRKPAKRVRFQ